MELFVFHDNIAKNLLITAPPLITHWVNFPCISFEGYKQIFYESYTYSNIFRIKAFLYVLFISWRSLATTKQIQRRIQTWMQASFQK